MGDHFIKKYWEDQAVKFGESHEASWGDKFMIALEVETVAKHIPDHGEILDVGCANGYSTFGLLEKRKVKSMTGVDFSESMIEQAQQAKQKRSANNVHFEVGDGRALRFPNNSFDAVYTTRMLINLPNWEEQKIAIRECLRVVKSGGTVIFSEAFWEPLVLLNALRSLKNLKPLVEHDFNRYLKIDKMDQFLKEGHYQFQREDFSSVYYLGTRFLRELLGIPGFDNPLNKIFYDLELAYSGGDLGIQQIYVVKVP